jgi:stalled ribosome rescue protein Dom34
MSYQGKKVVGVWMDNKHAFIISSADRKIGGDFDMIKKIERHEHNDDYYKNERVELAKDTQEIKKYFKAIADEIDQDQAIYIFGPGKAQEEFKNVLKENHHFDSKIIELGTSDKLSTNQMIAKVKAHFEEH